MAKQKISRDRLIELRDEHLQFLESSSAALDAGFLGEAKRMAVSLRVLFHETAHSHSILAQLGERQRPMVDTSHPYNPNNYASHHGLVAMRLTGGEEARFFAPLDDRSIAPRLTRFSDWWEKDIVIKEGHTGKAYTRRTLVLFAANKDGGAHVDPHLDTSFEGLKDGSGIGWVVTGFSSQANGSFIPDVQSHSIRQIAYEVSETFK
ncbi:hypothetical protein [Mesorhizobium sp. WSM3876]|uniref:hypothetical protein n=1 Tax=Mesorhizobium sp. WSM3876 TaxID=422277 RepID=UPI000BDCD3BE|nr:hypothetical protein [Mesorhizobium sp. WSM3876]PBB86016.1 hypothetical protein CK216_15575 [Mesorhizobium sp. WSM3876]